MSTEKPGSDGDVAGMDDRLTVYRMMLEARIFEQYAHRLFSRDRIVETVERTLE